MITGKKLAMALAVALPLVLLGAGMAMAADDIPGLKTGDGATLPSFGASNSAEVTPPLSVYDCSGDCRLGNGDCTGPGDCDDAGNCRLGNGDCTGSGDCDGAGNCRLGNGDCTGPGDCDGAGDCLSDGRICDSSSNSVSGQRCGRSAAGTTGCAGVCSR